MSLLIQKYKRLFHLAYLYFFVPQEYVSIFLAVGHIHPQFILKNFVLLFLFMCFIHIYMFTYVSYIFHYFNKPLLYYKMYITLY